jgi:hypothetical protein
MARENIIHKIKREETNSETWAKWKDNIKTDLKEIVCT